MTVTEPTAVFRPQAATDGGGPDDGDDGGGGFGGHGFGGGGFGGRGFGGRGFGRKELSIVVGAAAVLVVALVAWVLWPSHRARPKAVINTTLPQVRPLVGAGGGELSALLQTGQGTSYHARYHVTGDPARIGGSQDLEIWNAPPRRRADTVRTSDGHTYRSETFTDSTSATLCVQEDSAPWSCQAVDHPAGGSDAIAASVIAATSGQPVVVTNDTVAGRKVRCFTIAEPSDSLRICATANGVPVTVGNGAVGYQLTALDSSVPVSTFKPPATVHG